MGWLEKIIGAKQPSGGLDQADIDALGRDLGRLDQVSPGLAVQTLRFVVAGENDSVMLTLDRDQQKVTEALNPRLGWSGGGNWIEGRSDYILAARVWRPDVLRRYGQVLAIARGVRSFPPMPGSDRSPTWFRIILLEYGEARAALQARHFTYTHQRTTLPEDPGETLTVARLKDLLAVEGDGFLPILDSAFERTSNWMSSYLERTNPELLPDFDDHLRADPAARCAEIAALSGKARAYALRALARRGLTGSPWFELAINQASDSSKATREAAVLLLRVADPETLIARVEASFSSMKAGQRTELARAVSTACGEQASRLLRRLAATETNASVLAELMRLIGQEDLSTKGLATSEDGPEGYRAVDGTFVEAPPPPALTPDTPLTPSLRALIQQGFSIWRQDAERHNRETAGEKYFHAQPIPPAHADTELCALLEPGGEKLTETHHIVRNLISHWGASKERAAVQARILADENLTLWHLLRNFSPPKPGEHNLHQRMTSVFWPNEVASAIRARLGDGGLRTLAAACALLGDPVDRAMRFLLEPSYVSADLDGWPSEALWPYFAQFFDLFDEALGLAPPTGSKGLEETKALGLLGHFPKTPARYFSALIERAIGDRKTVRLPARELLASAPDLERLLIPILEHPKQETRAGAASWLAERGARTALPKLIAAAKAEKLASAKAALLGAIHRLGGDIGDFVSSEVLLAEAQSGLKKTSTKALDWFPFDAIPRITQVGGQNLDPLVTRWWLVLAAKLKEPGGNPWFELLLDQLDPASAAKLGATVLHAWISFDTIRPTDAEANAHAKAHADATLKSWQRWDKTVTYERIFALLRSTKLGEYVNSGNDSKGILALATRIAGADGVAIVRVYFRDHYPRTAQCKALLECLAANPSPVATQFVLSIAKRWRTRGVQELAAELVQAIADRRGWSPDQLADRTIPTGGFDDDGVLRLAVGEREYTARLNAEGKIQLFSPDGKAVQGLPSASAGEKNEALAAARATLSTAKKEVKQVFDFQTQRLYEALCVGRIWPTDEWSEYLLSHALVSRLVQRLIWIGLDERGEKAAIFRPMEDLTLTAADDEPVALDRFASVRLAHRTLLTSDETNALRRHLADYDVDPLFDQLGRPVLTLEPGQAMANEIIDRRGWLIEAFKLRGAANKLGYNRGAAEDGGVFVTYEKRFEALKLVSVIEFTGNGLPEENRLSALLGLKFVPVGKGGALRFGKSLPLRDVPPVLLSEAWNDLHTIAAFGTGFDAAWEKKASW